MRSSSTSATAIPGADLRLRPLPRPLRCRRRGGALLHQAQRAKASGSCPSTGVGTTARAIRRTPTGSRPTTCGSRRLTPRRASPRSSRTMRPARRVKDPRSGQEASTQIFPRYHQLDVVRKLLADARGAGCGPAIPDPALGWQRQVELDRLAGPQLGRVGAATASRFSIRSSSSPIAAILDQPDRRRRSSSSPRSARPSATPSTRATCASFIESGKKIIVSTVQKFPFILEDIGTSTCGRRVRDRDRRGPFEPGRARQQRR